MAVCLDSASDANVFAGQGAASESARPGIGEAAPPAMRVRYSLTMVMPVRAPQALQAPLRRLNSRTKPTSLRPTLRWLTAAYLRAHHQQRLQPPPVDGRNKLCTPQSVSRTEQKLQHPRQDPITNLKERLISSMSMSKLKTTISGYNDIVRAFFDIDKSSILGCNNIKLTNYKLRYRIYFDIVQLRHQWQEASISIFLSFSDLDL